MTTKLSDLLRHANHPGYAKDAEALESHIAELGARLETASRAGHLAAAEEVIDKVSAERDRYRAALERVDKMLTVPAAEYVPAIQDAFQIIDAALAG